MTGQLHERWPPERFLWAVVEEPIGTGRTRIRKRQIHFLAEPLFPVPLEALQVVSRPLGGGRHLVCAVEQDRLGELTEETLTLTPETLPEGLELEVPGSALNVLVGERVPERVRRARHRVTGEGLAWIFLVCLLALWGTERRSRAAVGWRQVFDRQAKAAITTALGEESSLAGGASGLPPALILTARVRELERTRGGVVPEAGEDERHVRTALQELLAGWPRAVPVRVESLVLTPTALSVKLDVGAGAERDALLRDLPTIRGWEARLPSVQNLPEGAHVTLRWERIQGRGP